jgi:hypothetical protein
MVAIWVYREDQMCRVPARREAQIIKALRANEAQGLLVGLIENGYEEFLGADGERYPVSEMSLELLGIAQ